ncbi:MAG TPA: hypothetical protein VME01_04840, partial [Solirubrobacteraceae bacterium]|nr:hypothetical protein [Solirubrobacteraceae bacterium]
GATTTSPTATCLAPGASITSKLTAKQAKTGAKLKFASATFKLGKHSKTVRKLPAKVSLSLRGLAPGRQTVTVTVNYTRRVFVPATRRSRARFATRKSKLTLRTRFTIC